MKNKIVFQSANFFLMILMSVVFAGLPVLGVVFAHTRSILTINNGAQETTNLQVMLHARYEGLPVPSQMRFANTISSCPDDNSADWSEWQIFSVSAQDWTLMGGDYGTRRVCIQTAHGNLGIPEGVQIASKNIKYISGLKSAENPMLDQSCGLDLVLALDSSVSIDSDSELPQMKTAFKGFVDELSGTPTEFAVVEFDNTAWISQGFTVNGNLAKTAIDAAQSSGATNWEDALLKAQSMFPNRDCKQNLIIFASDGDPTVNNDSQATGWETDNNDLENAIIAANNIKTSGARIITLGIGNEVTQSRMEAISSSDAYYPVADFDALAAVLRDLAAGMCGGTITVTKKIGVEGNWAPAGGWSFNIGGQSKVTDAINGQTEAVELANGDDYAVTETPQADYSLFDASCAITNNGGGAVGTFDSGNNRVSGIAVDAQNIIACSFYNKVNCQKIYGAESCFKDGWAKKDYTWNFSQFCGATGSEEYEKTDCACVEKSSKVCTGARTSTTTYYDEHGYGYCSVTPSYDNPDDADCDSAWTCGDWANAECVSNDEGGKRKQTQSCTDQYGSQKTNEQIVNDSGCGCSQTETGRNCFADGMARVEYSAAGQSYCSGTFTAEESDASCACGYSDWQNGGCAGDGVMNQMRTQTTQFDYCAALTQTVPDASCALPDPVLGCTDSTATNYNSSATQDDGSCQYPPEVVSGCTDSTATNYNANATKDDGSCQYPQPSNGGSSSGGSSSGGGGTSGQYMPGYGPNAGGGIAPQVAGAAIDLDEIARQIEAIRQKVNNLADQVADFNKGVLGATSVATGVCDTVLPQGGDYGDELSAAIIYAKLRAEFCRPDLILAPAKPKK